MCGREGVRSARLRGLGAGIREVSPWMMEGDGTIIAVERDDGSRADAVPGAVRCWRLA